MKSQQTLRYSTTHHHSVSQSTSHTMTSNDYHEWPLTSNRRFTTHPLRLFSHSHSQRNRNRDRDTTTSCHIRQYSHWQYTIRHHLPRGENHGGWCPVRERLTLAPIVDGHMINGDQWRSMEITENHRVSQCHTDEHRLPQSDTDSQRGAARNMDSHIMSMWHWVMNGIGWWFSWSLGIEGDEYHSVVASMGIIWTQRHRWTLTGWWHSLDDDSHGWWVPPLVTNTGREQSPSGKRHRLLTLHEQC